MKPSKLLYIDRLFKVPHEMLGLAYLFVRKWIPKNQSYDQDVLLIKLMGMGSLVKLAHQLKNDQVDFDRIVLCTFQTNLELAKLLGFKQFQVIPSPSFLMVMSCLKIPFQREYAWVIDAEREVYTTGLLRMYLAFIGRAKSIYFSYQNDKKSELDFGYCINNRSHSELFQELIPHLKKRVSAAIPDESNAREKNILVNINASDYLSARRFPLNGFLELIKKIHSHYPEYEIYLTGSPSERGYVNQLVHQLQKEFVSVQNVAGHWSLPQLFDNLKKAEIFVTNDSGPMHVGAMLGTPMVVIWGPTQAGYSGYTNEASIKNISLNLPCSPCFIGTHVPWGEACSKMVSCMHDLDVQKVFDGFVEILPLTPQQ